MDRLYHCLSLDPRKPSSFQGVRRESSCPNNGASQPAVGAMLGVKTTLLIVPHEAYFPLSFSTMTFGGLDHHGSSCCHLNGPGTICQLMKIPSYLLTNSHLSTYTSESPHGSFTIASKGFKERNPRVVL